MLDELPWQEGLDLITIAQATAVAQREASQRAAGQASEGARLRTMQGGRRMGG
jgi:hypothetical protein